MATTDEWVRNAQGETIRYMRDESLVAGETEE